MLLSITFTMRDKKERKRDRNKVRLREERRACEGILSILDMRGKVFSVLEWDGGGEFRDRGGF